MEVPQRHHPGHSGRHRVLCPHHGQGDLSGGENWKKPITIARHAYGDVYKSTEYGSPAPAGPSWSSTGRDGQELCQTIYDFECPACSRVSTTRDSPSTSFCPACFQYAVDTRQDLWFATKDTISKYDHTFKDIFQEVYEKEYQERFETMGLTYFYTLIDDAVARVIRPRAGYMACKNYDGDVMSDGLHCLRFSGL